MKDVSESGNLAKYFWNWLAISILAIAVVSSISARAADVFIDEGDADFAPTPVSEEGGTPAPGAPAASVPSDLDNALGSLDPAPPGVGTAPTSPEMAVVETAVPETQPPQEPIAKSKKAAKKVEKKSSKKVAKKESSKKKIAKKKDATKGSGKNKIAKKKKETGKKVAGKKEKSKKSAGKSDKKRKVASAGSFAGGQYEVTSRDCNMESAPGAGDVVGTTKASKKLWVEKSGSSKYWKVYNKTGSPAYLSRKCF